MVFKPTVISKNLNNKVERFFGSSEKLAKVKYDHFH